MADELETGAISINLATGKVTEISEGQLSWEERKTKEMKVRIIKRVAPDGRVRFVIQQRHFLFRWWVDAWINSLSGASCIDSFDTLKEAKENMCWFDGTKFKETVISP